MSGWPGDSPGPRLSQQPGRLTLSQHILWRPLSPQGSPWDVNLEARIVLEGGGLLEGSGFSSRPCFSSHKTSCTSLPRASVSPPEQ